MLAETLAACLCLNPVPGCTMPSAPSVIGSYHVAQLDPRVVERFHAALENYTRDPRSRSLFRIKTGQTELGPNLADNPGFEEVWGEGGHEIPEGEEWRKGVAHGWGATPRFYEQGGVIDTITYDEKDPEFGWRSGRIAHADGYYLRSRIGKVSPDDTYHARVYVKLHRLSEMNLEHMPEATLQVRWWGNGWIRRNEYRFSTTLTEPGKWIALETVAVPDDAADYAAVFLLVSGMDVGTEVLFDNLSFRRVRDRE